MSFELIHIQQAKRDAKNLKGTPLATKAKQLLDLVRVDPFAAPPSSEALVVDLMGATSRRTNIQHRPVYQVLAEERTFKVIRL